MQHRGQLSDGSGITVLCSSVTKFHIDHNDVEFVKRAFAADVLVHFILYVLMKLSSVGRSFVAGMPL